MLPAPFFSIALLALAVFWAVGAYKRLTRLKNAVAQGVWRIDAQLQLRHTLIAELVEACRVHLGHEPDLLNSVNAASGQSQAAVAALRSQPASASAAAALGVAEQVLSDCLGQLVQRLQTLASTAAEIRADAGLQSMLDQWTATENKLGFAREGYNEAVTLFNQAVRQFPALILARLFGFAPSATLQTGRSGSSSVFGDIPPVESR